MARSVHISSGQSALTLLYYSSQLLSLSASQNFWRASFSIFPHCHLFMLENLKTGRAKILSSMNIRDGACAVPIRLCGRLAKKQKNIRIAPTRTDFVPIRNFRSRAIACLLMQSSIGRAPCRLDLLRSNGINRSGDISYLKAFLFSAGPGMGGIAADPAYGVMHQSAKVFVGHGCGIVTTL